MKLTHSILKYQVLPALEGIKAMTEQHRQDLIRHLNVPSQVTIDGVPYLCKVYDDDGHQVVVCWWENITEVRGEDKLFASRNWHSVSSNEVISPKNYRHSADELAKSLSVLPREEWVRLYEGFKSIAAEVKKFKQDLTGKCDIIQQAVAAQPALEKKFARLEAKGERHIEKFGLPWTLSAHLEGFFDNVDPGDPDLDYEDIVTKTNLYSIEYINGVESAVGDLVEYEGDF